MKIILVLTIINSVCHLASGLISICVGVAASIKADIWLAHVVSPIWSGAFFLVTGILGIGCATKQKTAYLIMCFAGFSVVSLVTGVVSIQLLRLGLVNQTTDGLTFLKENKDVLILIALTTTAAECAFCIVSSFLSCRLASDAKLELQRKREGTFHVQVLGEKDIMLVSRESPGGIEKREKIFATSL